MNRKPEAFWKQALAVFAVTALLYFGGFWLLEKWRARRGPWEVTFRATASGVPVVEIAQPRLGIAGVQLVFRGTNVLSLTNAITLRFEGPELRKSAPFGQVRFLDTTMLPGTVTLDLFGHEVELLPRRLMLDKREYPWQSGERIELSVR